jgi:acyl-CoA thioesterase
VGSLDLDTRLAGDAERACATLSPDWRIWGPNGGYVAAIALRAAGRASAFSRPASFACHFLGVGAFDVADVEATSLRRGRNAESLHVVLAQGGRPFLDARVWSTDASTGLEHDFAAAPAVPSPASLRPFDELYADEPHRYPFWDNLEGRPTDWVPDAEWQPGAPSLRCWYRFRPDARFEHDAFLDAGRALILIDTLSWPAACRAHREDENPWMAPSLDLAARFHRAPPYTEWLLVQASADVATEGLIGFHNRVWDEAGHLVASGGGSLLCRPKPASPA